MKLTWSKDKRQTGLARVCAGPRGWTLRVDGVRAATVNPLYEGFSRTVTGWYYTTGWEYGLPRRQETHPDEEAAKLACREFVLSIVKAPGPQ